MGQVIEGHEGNPVGADKLHRLLTFSTIFSEDHFAARNADAYVMDIDSVTTDGANYWLAVIKNTDDDDLIVTSVTLWYAGGFNGDCIIEAYLGSTFTYASNGTLLVPANLRSGVTGGADGLFYVNDGTGNITTITAGSIAGRMLFDQKPTRWVKASGWVVPKNQTFMLWSDKDGETWRGFISFYYHRS